MKLQIPILAIVLLLPIYSHAADVTSQISARYAAVDRAVSKIKPVTCSLKGWSSRWDDKDDELTAFFRKGVPVKIIVKSHSKTIRTIDEFYFWKGRLFFVLNTRESYGKTPGASSSYGDNWRPQNRFYFTNGKLTRWVDFEYQTNLKGLEFEQKAQLRYAREMLAIARSKSKATVAP